MRKSWLDGLGPRRSIPGRKQGEGCAKNDRLFFSANTGMCRESGERRVEAGGKDCGSWDASMESGVY